MTENTATAAQSLERTDRAILRHLAFAVQNVKAAQAAVVKAADERPDAIQHAAATLSREAAALEAIRLVVGATGAADRNLSLAGEAMAGNDENL